MAENEDIEHYWDFYVKNMITYNIVSVKNNTDSTIDCEVFMRVQHIWQGGNQTRVGTFYTGAIRSGESGSAGGMQGVPLDYELKCR